MTFSYAVIGTGAIGGYYGTRLARSGCDVHFLLRSDCEHVKENGIVVDSVEGDFALQSVKAYNNAAKMPPVDVVLVCLKTTHNHQLPDLLPPLKSSSAIIPLQNGLGIEERIEQSLAGSSASTATILGGLCFICANKVGPGHIRHIDYGRLLLGAHVMTGSNRERDEALLGAIAADFNRAEVAAKITDDLPMARWLKLVWNVPYNALSVILNATTEEMMADGSVRTLILTLMREVVSVANAWGEQNGRPSDKLLSEQAVTQMFEQTETMPPYLTSMKLDYNQKRPLEIAAILGAPLQAAKSLHVSVPAMTMLHQQLAFLNARNLQ